MHGNKESLLALYLIKIYNFMNLNKKESKLKMSLSHLGKPPISEETRLKQSIRSKKMWLNFSPEDRKELFKADHP